MLVHESLSRLCAGQFFNGSSGSGDAADFLAACMRLSYGKLTVPSKKELQETRFESFKIQKTCPDTRGAGQTVVKTP